MLLIAFMQVSLAANAQKISLSKRNAPLTEIFKELRKQSGYDFVINKDQIKIAKPVTILVNGDDLINVLNKCFEDQPFTYSMEDRMIIVVNKNPSQMKIILLPINVKGRIVNEQGKAMPGASVNIKGTDRKVITNDNGEFSFFNVADTSKIIISFLGYENVEVLAKAELGDIKMKINIASLEEVAINTGYQLLRPNETNGSIAVISKNQLEARGGSNILDRLVGQSSGLLLNIGKTNSNNPQNKTNISIRGLGTINGPLDPLIVLDGFIYDGDISNLNLRKRT